MRVDKRLNELIGLVAPSKIYCDEELIFDRTIEAFLSDASVYVDFFCNSKYSNENVESVNIDFNDGLTIVKIYTK